MLRPGSLLVDHVGVEKASPLPLDFDLYMHAPSIRLNFLFVMLGFRTNMCAFVGLCFGWFGLTGCLRIRLDDVCSAHMVTFV
jgi:hypothetical protein